MCIKGAYWFDREESMNTRVDSRLKGVKDTVYRECEGIGAVVTAVVVSVIEVGWSESKVMWRKMSGVMMNIGLVAVWISGEGWKNEIAKAVYIASLLFLILSFKQASHESLLLIVLKPLLLVSGQDL